MRDYPHQFSGGMRQRVLIAMAIASRPKVLLADEPTTALDVIIQDQILSLLLELQRDFGMSMILVSHDLGVIARDVRPDGRDVRRADRRAGRHRDAARPSPRHPYTISLLRSLPDIEHRRPATCRRSRGTPPPLIDMPARVPVRAALPARDSRSATTWETELLAAGRAPPRPLLAPRGDAKEARGMAGAELRVGVIGARAVGEHGPPARLDARPALRARRGVRP